MTTRLYSSASSRTWSVTSPSSTVSASTHSAAPAPVTPEPIRARSPARSTAAFTPPGSRPTCSMVATTPWVG